jgi:hypothetical protein
MSDMGLYIHSSTHLHGIMLNYLSTGGTLPYQSCVRRSEFKCCMLKVKDSWSPGQLMNPETTEYETGAQISQPWLVPTLVVRLHPAPCKSPTRPRHRPHA